ncbi:MAG: ABC transporter ATP-binding protein [Dehalococcoidales bacterium]|nr:ABC transporter ATP-binding protein [Dehalococcoidales bacterium]
MSNNNIPDKKYTVPEVIRTIFRCAPLPILLNLVLSIINGLTLPVQVLFVAKFLDSAIDTITGNGNFSDLVVYILCILGIHILSKCIGTAMTLGQTRTINRLREKLSPVFLQKRASLEYSNIENPETLDLINRVVPKSDMAFFIQMFQDTLSLISALFQLGGIIVILATHVWWAAIVMLAVSTPLLIISVKGGKAAYELNREVSALTRVMEYFSDILTNRETAAERSLFGFTGYINEKFKGSHKIRTDKNLKNMTFWTVRSRAGGLLLILFGIFMMILLVSPLSDGVLTIGEYVALIGATISFVNTSSWQTGSILNSFANDIEYIKDISRFMNLGEHPGVLEPQGREINFDSIEFRNVSFKYPGTDRYIFTGLNLEFVREKHYAVVGINGAGKTTLVKLMTGLYRVEEGEILLNGRNINEYDYNELTSLYGIVYQDLARYDISIRDNITFGHEPDAGVMEDTLDKSGLSELVRGLPQGLDTILGKTDTRGIDISGGEWQKIAIARAISRRSRVKILDEPTAALSPVAESEIYRQFDKLTESYTTILISHRLGSTKLADIILVIDGGRVIEQGTHAELMNKNGLYATMFTTQKEWYDD